jgi:hypothetical protein
VKLYPPFTVTEEDVDRIGSLVNRVAQDAERRDLVAVAP